MQTEGNCDPTRASAHFAADGENHQGLDPRYPAAVWKPAGQLSAAESLFRYDDGYKSTAQGLSKSKLGKHGSNEADLFCALESRLTNGPYKELRSIKLGMTHDRIVLKGNVSCFFLKQMAQEAIRPLAGLRKIDNRVVVNAE
ncbi:MAG: hypothetical protein ACE361_26380 [Aureliella sp.]